MNLWIREKGGAGVWKQERGPAGGILELVKSSNILNKINYTFISFSSLSDQLYKCNFKVPSKQREEYPVYNGTLQTLIWS